MVVVKRSSPGFETANKPISSCAEEARTSFQFPSAVIARSSAGPVVLDRKEKRGSVETVAGRVDIVVDKPVRLNCDQGQSGRLPVIQ